MKVTQIEWTGPDRETKYGLMSKGDIFLASISDANNFCESGLSKLFNREEFKEELSKALDKKTKSKTRKTAT